MHPSFAAAAAATTADPGSPVLACALRLLSLLPLDVRGRPPVIHLLSSLALLMLICVSPSIACLSFSRYRGACILPLLSTTKAAAHTLARVKGREREREQRKRTETWITEGRERPSLAACAFLSFEGRRVSVSVSVSVQLRACVAERRIRSERQRQKESDRRSINSSVCGSGIDALSRRQHLSHTS